MGAQATRPLASRASRAHAASKPAPSPIPLMPRGGNTRSPEMWVINNGAEIWVLYVTHTWELSQVVLSGIWSL